MSWEAKFTILHLSEQTESHITQYRRSGDEYLDTNRD